VRTLDLHKESFGIKINIQTFVKLAITKFLLLFISITSVQISYSQARIIINNASFINITNGSFLVIDNSASNAISRIGTSGWIISEGIIGNNRVKWKVGSTADTFTIPFGFSTTIDLPLTFTTSSAVGSGNVIFSTYRSGVNSSSLPTGGSVVPQTMIPTSYLSAGSDNSAFGVDRFYQIDATDPIFTTKPTLSDIIFSYATTEFDASITANTIVEGNLQAQYWDNTDTDWRPLTPLGTVTTASNIVTVSSHSPALLAKSKWWSLVDNAHPLPIILLSFTGECQNSNVEIKWSTITEINNERFVLEKSNDGEFYFEIATIEGSGTTNDLHSYSFIDKIQHKLTAYYRLKQFDYNGVSSTFPVITLSECDKSTPHLTTNAYFSNRQQNVQVLIDSEISSAFSIAIYDALGSLVAFKDISSFVGENKIIFEGLNQPAGVYLVVITNSENLLTHKIIMNNS
jgi:hypothetical protein